MALTQEDLLIAIRADTSNAVKSIEELKKSMNGIKTQTENAEEAVTGFGAALVKLNQGLEIANKAWDLLAGTMFEAIDEANKATTAFDRLAITLKTFGDTNARNTAQGIAEYADELERLTGANSESLQALVSQAAAAGLTADKYKTLMKAAVGLSTQTGSVDSAGQALLVTLKGQTRSVEVYAKELKGMSPVSLQSGKAIDVLADKLGSLGVAFGKTAEGINARYKAALGNVFEELGHLLNDTFDLLDSKEGKISFLESVTLQIKDANLAIQDFKTDVKAAFMTMQNLDWGAIAKGILVVGGAIGSILASIHLVEGAAGGEKLFKFVDLMVDKLKMLTVAVGRFLLVGAQITIVTAAVLGLAAAFELIALNLNKLDKLGELTFWQLTRGVLRARIALNEFFGDKKEAAALKMRLEGVTQTTEELKKNLDFGVTGRVFDTIGGFMDEFRKNQAAIAAETKKTSDAADSAAQGEKQSLAISEEALQKKKELYQLLAQLNEQANTSTQNEIAGLQQKAVLDKQNLLSKIQETAKVVELSKAEQDRLFAIGSANIDASKTRAIYEKQKQVIDDIREKTRSVQIENEKFGASKNELIDIELRRQMELIELDRERLKQQGLYNEQVEQELKIREAAEKQRAENNRPSTIDRANEGISKVSSTIGGWAGIIMSIPQIIKSLASLVDAITNLPQTFVSFYKDFHKNLEKFWLNFKTNLANGIADFFEEFVDHQDKIHDLIGAGVQKLVESLPSVLERLLPSVTKWIKSAILGIARSIGLLLRTIIKSVASSKAVTQAIYEIVVALMQGIVEGIAEFGDEIGRMMRGEFRSFGEDAGNGFVDTVKKLSGSGDRLFSVSDVANDAGDQVQNIISKIKEEAKNVGESIWDAFWNFFKSIGTSIWDLFMKASVDAPIATWNFIKSFAQAMWDAMVDIFSKFNPFSDDFIFSMEQLKVIGNMLADAFETLKKFTVDSIVEPLKWTWQFIQGFGVALDQAFWQPIKNGFINLGKWLDDTLWQPMGDKLGQFGNWFKNGFDSVWDWLSNGFSNVFNNVGGFFKNLFKFDGGGKGAVENFLGFDFPWLAFSKGGVVPGVPSFKGDNSRNDTVPALLSPGEVVIPRSMMQDDAFARVIDAKFKGQKVQGHALGKLGRIAAAVVTGGASEVINSKPAQIVTQAVTPKWAQDLFNSINRFASNVSLPQLILNPTKELNRAIKESLGAFQGFFRQMMHFNEGGFVPGTGSRDTVPAMLTPGEFVMSREMVSNMRSNGQRGGNTYSFNITMDITNKDTMDESFVRNRMIPRIKEELKRSSLDGEFVISQRGIR